MSGNQETQQRDQPPPEEQVEDFEEEATEAKRSHGEPAEVVLDTAVDTQE